MEMRASGGRLSFFGGNNFMQGLSIFHALRRALAVSAGLMLWVWSTRRFAGRLHGR